LRPEDQVLAEPWSRIWDRWASAAFVGGYLLVAGKAPFVPSDRSVTAIVLETALLDQSLRDIRFQLLQHSTTIATPLRGIIDVLQGYAAHQSSRR
jgi:hypothetical protein